MDSLTLLPSRGSSVDFMRLVTLLGAGARPRMRFGEDHGAIGEAEMRRAGAEGRCGGARHRTTDASTPARTTVARPVSHPD